MSCRRIGLLITLVGGMLFAGKAVAQSSVSEPVLRFDGVYRSGPDTDSAGGQYCGFLRFYPKGGVVAVSSECGDDVPRQLRNWFTWTEAKKTGSGLQRGSYQRKEGTIAFVTVSDYGKVSYRGVIEGDTLRLDTRSFINGHRDSETFVFIDWSH